MRTAIILGLNLIALAIARSNGIDSLLSEDAGAFYALVVIVLMVMDVVDFFRGKEK